MTIALHHLSKKIIGELKKINSPLFDQRSKHFTIEFELDEKIDLKNITTCIKTSPIAFYKDAKSKNTHLGYGTCTTIRTKDQYEQIDSLLMDENVFLFGGKRFDSERPISNEWRALGDVYFFIPRIHFWSDRLNTKLLISFSEFDFTIEKNIKPEVIFDIFELLNFQNTYSNSPVYKYDHQVPGKEDWNKGLKNCLDSFESNNMTKVVLSRKQVYKSSINSDMRSWLNKHDDTKSESNTFYFKFSDTDAFISLSPEKLFSIKDNKIEIDAIAGSTTRSQDLSEDQLLGNNLLSNEKELNEHRIVSDSVKNSMIELGLDPEKTKDETLLKLHYIQHIYSLFKSNLDPNIKISNIIENLHPTPAVGGRPKSIALEVIRNFEEFDRGLYAAPVGMLNKNNTKLIVGIRSALMNGTDLHIFGGAGIVPGSIAINEWNETQNKMKAISELFI
ncbi:MAG: isochorismate synthase [Bacteriovoracaceae bacterium]|nr:isochorismate synthase [Bacteriovoracaceae bacterium]